MHAENQEGTVLWENYTRPDCRDVRKSGDILASEEDGEELPTTLCVMVYSLLKESTLVPAEGPKLSVKGTSPADMDAGRSRSQASLPSFTRIFSAPFNLLLTLSQSLDPTSI